MEDSGLKKVLDAAESVLGVITTVGSIPGVELIPYVGTVLKFLSFGKALVAAGKTVEPDVTDFLDTFKNGLPSEDVRAALDARIASNHAAIQGFVPVAEPGEQE